MKPLVINGKKADFSLVCDGLTIYPKNISSKFDRALVEYKKLNFIKHPLRSMRNHRNKKREEEKSIRQDIDFAYDIKTVGYRVL